MPPLAWALAFIAVLLVFAWLVDRRHNPGRGLLRPASTGWRGVGDPVARMERGARGTSGNLNQANTHLRSDAGGHYG